MIIGISGKMQHGKDTIGKILQWYLTRPDMSFESFELLSKEEREVKWQIKKYGYKLKQIASILTGIPVEDFEREDIKAGVLGNEWVRDIYYYDETKRRGYRRFETGLFSVKKEQYTVRQLLQELGTDAMRNNIHENVWVNALFADYKPFPYQGVDYSLMGLGQGNEQREKFVEKLIYPNWIITDVRFPNEDKAISERGGYMIRVNRPNMPTNDHPSETSLDKGIFDAIIENDGTMKDLQKKVLKLDILKEFKIKRT